MQGIIQNNINSCDNTVKPNYGYNIMVFLCDRKKIRD